MPLHIEDEKTVDLVTELASRLRTTKQDAVRTVVEAELVRLTRKQSFRDRLLAFYEEFPLSERTGLEADKAFFDGLSGKPL